MNKTNTIVTLGRFMGVSFLVLLLSNVEVCARGASSRGSIKHSSSSARLTSSRSSTSSSRTASLNRSASTRNTSSARLQSGSANVNRNVNTSNRSANANRNINTSNRNINVNRNVNVNVNHHHNNHWNDREDARRDWMRYRTVNHLIRAGTYWATRPKSSTTIVVSGASYYYWGGMYYAPSGSGYIVVSPPPTAVVYAIPVTATPVHVNSKVYYYYGGIYYLPTTKPADKPKEIETTVNVNASADASGGKTKPEKMDAPEMTKDDSSYEVVVPPVGATVPYLPDDAKETNVNGKKYFVQKETYYRPFVSEGETIYMIVDNPESQAKKGK